MTEDVRDSYDPLHEVPTWFWDQIAAAQADPKLFEKLSDDELINVADTMIELQSLFWHDPFDPREVCEHVTENSLARNAAWVISRGKEFFLSVWQEPERFWHIMANDEPENGHNFEFAPAKVWRERHGTDIPTM